jgi:hypothetical protein
MRRRLLDLCLLAYPRVRRERDRDYLRDLALDLSETYGLRHQALSLLRGGLGERIEIWRLRRGSGHLPPMKRVVVACLVLAVTGLTAVGLVELAAGEANRVGAHRFACVETDHLRPKGDRAHVEGRGGCAEARRLVAARRRAGWDCATRRRTKDGQHAIRLRCARGKGASSGARRA